MYLKRNVDLELEKWRVSASRKPILMGGARQVGKSSSVRELAKKFDYFIISLQDCFMQNISNIKFNCFQPGKIYADVNNAARVDISSTSQITNQPISTLVY
jgi:hypothetical protein